MKYFWIACEVSESGKHYAYIMRVFDNDNLKCRLDGVQNLTAANIMSTKTKVRETVELWNAAYKANGTYMFDKIDF